jgi:hypothetical protein
MSKASSQISTLDEAPSAPATPMASTVEIPSEGFSGSMEIVTIHSGQEDGGDNDVFIGHNNFGRLIKRNAPVKIPTEVAQVLRDAVYVTYKDGAEHKKPRFALTCQPA